MNVCFFGIYDKEYSRNRVLISGFHKLGYEVYHCLVDPLKESGIKKYVGLYREYKKIKNTKFEYFIVAFPGHTVVWLARLLFGGNIIFDAFVSLYNSVVEERKEISRWNPRAYYYRFFDWFSCTLAEKVLLDTNTHIDYFVETYNIPRKKFTRVFVGTTPADFYPLATRKQGDIFHVHFHGHFTPLHGVEWIVKAAKILSNEKDIKFRIIGNGMGRVFQKMSIDYGLENIEFVGDVPLWKLNNYINEADVCLGIFGNTEKSQMVIPNKVYEAIACKKAVITERSKAIMELFLDQENMVLCSGANAGDLADKIWKLRSDSILREKISSSGYKVFIQKLQPQMIVKDIIKK